MPKRGRPLSVSSKTRRVGRKRNPVYSSDVERRFDSQGVIKRKGSHRTARVGGTRVGLHSYIDYDAKGHVVDTDRRLFTGHTKRKKRNPLER